MFGAECFGPDVEICDGAIEGVDVVIGRETEGVQKKDVLPGLLLGHGEIIKLES